MDDQAQMIIGMTLEVIGHITALMHVFGIVLIYRNWSKLGHLQRILFVHLSVCELQFLIGFSLTEHINHPMVELIIHTHLDMSGYFLYWVQMMMLALNRFLEIYLNVKYPLYCTKQRLLILIAAVWVVSFGADAMVIYFVYHNKIGDFEFELFKYGYYQLALESVLVTTTAACYTYIGYKIYSNNKHAPRLQNNSQQPGWKEGAKKLIIPGVLFITYVMFTTVPNAILGYVIHEETDYWKYEGLHMMYILGYLADVLIYALLSPPLRKDLSALKCRCKAN